MLTVALKLFPLVCEKEVSFSMAHYLEGPEKIDISLLFLSQLLRHKENLCLKELC